MEFLTKVQKCWIPVLSRGTNERIFGGVLRMYLISNLLKKLKRVKTLRRLGLALRNPTFFENMILNLGKLTGLFITYRIRNLNNVYNPSKFFMSEFSYLNRQIKTTQREIITESIGRPLSNEIALIIQGPISHRQNFTLNSVERYLELYPGIKIVLSTWSGEDTRSFDRLTKIHNLIIIRNELPKYSGISSVNYQIVSSRMGIEACLKYDVKYILKTRSDQCLFSPNFVETLFTMYKNFGQNGVGANRILVTSLNTFVFRKFSVSDMLQFGPIEEVLLYWSPPLLEEIDGNSTSRDTHSNNIHLIPEQYLMSQYLSKKGIDVDFSFNQSLEAYRDFFLIINSCDVEQIWNKFTRNENRWAVGFFPDKYSEVSFADWLELQTTFERFLTYSKNSYLNG